MGCLHGERTSQCSLFLLLIPLYFSQGLDLHRFNVTLLTAPLPPMAAPPPPPPAAVQRMVHEIPKSTFTPGKLTAPSFVPKIVAAVSNEVAPPDLTLASQHPSACRAA